MRFWRGVLTGVFLTLLILVALGAASYFYLRKDMVYYDSGPDDDDSYTGLFHALFFDNDQDDSSRFVRLPANEKSKLTYVLTYDTLAELDERKTVVVQADEKVGETLDDCVKDQKCSLQVQFICSICGLHPDTGYSWTSPLIYDPKKRTTIPVVYEFTPVVPSENGAGESHAPIESKAPPGITIQILRFENVVSSIHVCVDVGEDSYSCTGSNQALANPKGVFAQGIEYVSEYVSEHLFPDSAGQPRTALLSTPGSSATSPERSLTSPAIGLTRDPAFASDVALFIQTTSRGALESHVRVHGRELIGELVAELRHSATPADIKLADVLAGIGRDTFEVSTELPTVSSLKDLRGSAYDWFLELSCAIGKGDLGDENPFRLQVAERQIVCKTFASIADYQKFGFDLFRVLFPDETDAQRLMVALATLAEARALAYDQRALTSANDQPTPYPSSSGSSGYPASTSPPLRMSVFSQDTHLPVQLMRAHVRSGARGQSFLGLIFDIVELPISASGKMVSPNPMFEASVPMIGLFTEGKSVTYDMDCKVAFSVEAERLACQSYFELRARYKRWFGQDLPVPVVTKKKFMDTLRELNSKVGMIFFYGHGSAVNSDDAKRRIPSLVFQKPRDSSPGDDLKATQFRSLAQHNSYPFLHSRPMVVLIACELGADSPPDSPTITSAFVSLGARGVVAAEVEILEGLGATFLLDLTDSMHAREVEARPNAGNPSLALLLARRKAHADAAKLSAQTDHQRKIAAKSQIMPLLLYYHGRHGGAVTEAESRFDLPLNLGEIEVPAAAEQ